MKILLASSNEHKLSEIKEMLEGFEIYALSEILTPFDIAETGVSFKENALIKANAVFKTLSDEQKDEFMVLSDDSGLCVEALNDAPGIYSARFSPEQNDKANNAKLISELEKLGASKSKAHYSACMALVCKFGKLSAHGYLHGAIINEERGENGFGYDPLFVPQGFSQTLAELSPKIKASISHRSKALRHIQFLLGVQKF